MEDRTTQLYFQARNRALERHIDTEELHRELQEGFARGLAAVDPAYDGSDAMDPDNFMSRVLSESNFGIGFVLGAIARLEAVKGKAYQASWQKRGEKDGAMVNVERKFDRLDATVRKDATGETKSQILGDLSVYASKWLVYRAELDPAEFLTWLKEIRSL